MFFQQPLNPIGSKTNCKSQDHIIVTAVIFVVVVVVVCCCCCHEYNNFEMVPYATK